MMSFESRGQRAQGGLAEGIKMEDFCYNSKAKAEKERDSGCGFDLGADISLTAFKVCGLGCYLTKPPHIDPASCLSVSR